MSSPLDIIVPIVMGAALLWWIGRSMSRQALLIATAVTLMVIVGVLLVQTPDGADARAVSSYCKNVAIAPGYVPGAPLHLAPDNPRDNNPQMIPFGG